MRKLIVLISSFLLLCSCASLKPHPRPWTKGEKVAAGFFLVAHAADWYTTERYLDNPQNWEKTNKFLLGEHPSDTKLAVYFPISGFVALALGHWYPELRYPLLVTYGGINTYNAIGNTDLY